MVGPIYKEDAIDNLNEQLFEVSETNNSDPRSFFESVASILRAAGMPIKDASLMSFEDDDFDTTELPEGPPRIAQMQDEDGFLHDIYLYLAYSRARGDFPFASHAELITQDDLSEIIRLSNLATLEKMSDEE